MKYISIESYPNREIRLTLCRSPSARQRYSLKDVWLDDDPESETPLSFAQKSRTPKERRSSGNQGAELRPGFGGLPRFQVFSTYGRRTLLRAGGALEKYAPHSECLFLTVTLPGSTREAMEAMASYSGKAVKLLHDWIGNHISSKLSMYTWELQKRGALHLHYVLHCPDRERGEWIIKNLKCQWIRILDAIAQASKIDIYRKHKGFSWVTNKEIVRVDAQWCEKSVAAYLSKYVSKAAESNRTMSRKTLCPSRWYGVSRPLLKLLREMSFKVTLDNLRSSDAWGMYEDCLSLLQSFSLKCYEYIHKVGGGQTVVSYSLSEDQQSLWTTIMNQICPQQDSSSNTEANMRRLARNGSILIRKHLTWLKEFNSYYGRSRPANLLNSHSFKDLSRSDLIFLLDALAYSFRSHQRTRFELPGECKLWYSTMKSCLESATSEDKEWIGAFKM